MKRGIATFIDPQALMAALYAFAVAMALGLVLLFIALVVQKFVLERRRRSEEEAFERLCAHLSSGRADEPAPMEPTQAVHRRALSRALARLNRRGAPHHATLDAAQDALVRYLQRDTRHAHWGRRTAALEALGRLEIDALLPFFLAFADQEPDRRVFGAALSAAARLCCSADQLRDLSVLLVAKPALSRSFNESILYLAFDALSQRQPAPANHDAIVQFVASLPPGHVLLGDALAAAARCKVRGVLPLAELICANRASNLTLRLTALRTIGRLQPDHVALESALRDAAWEARAVAAGHLRSLRNGAVEGLRAALRDRNFHVRRNAADALASLGGPGLEVLREMLDCDDRFAQDAARTALGPDGHGILEFARG